MLLHLLKLGLLLADHLQEPILTQKPQSVIFIFALQRKSFSPLELPALAPVPDAVLPDSAPADDVPWSETHQGYEGLQCEMNVLFEDLRTVARQVREDSDR